MSNLMHLDKIVGKKLLAFVVSKIIMAYAGVDAKEAKDHKPKVVFVDEKNHISRITSYEKHGLLKDME